MENTNKTLIDEILDIAAMLEEGEVEDTAHLVRMLHDVAEKARQDVCAEESDAEDSEDDIIREPDLLTVLGDEGLLGKRNIVIPVPTIYGKALLWNPRDVGRAYDALNGTERPGLFCEPAFIQGKNIQIPALKDFSMGDWLFIWVDPQYADDMEALASGYEYVGRDEYGVTIPVNLDQIRSQDMPVCETPEDIAAVAMAMASFGALTFRLPYIFWKVTKPGRVCKGLTYEMGIPCKYQAEIHLHKSGFHFATDPKRLLTWYTPFRANNEVYVVQVDRNSDVIIDPDDTGVARSIMLTKRIAWEDLPAKQD